MGNINYKNFFDALKKNIFFESENGTISLYELFRIPLNNLKQIYITLKKEISDEDDPLLKEITTANTDSDIRLKFEIVRDVLAWKLEETKRKELEARKRQLEKWLRETELENLKRDPDKIREELEKISELLSSD